VQGVENFAERDHGIEFHVQHETRRIRQTMRPQPYWIQARISGTVQNAARTLANAEAIVLCATPAADNGQERQRNCLFLRLREPFSIYPDLRPTMRSRSLATPSACASHRVGSSIRLEPSPHHYAHATRA